MEKFNIFSKLVNIFEKPFVRWGIAIVALVLIGVSYLPGQENFILRFVSESVIEKWGLLFIIIVILAIFAIICIDGPKLFFYHNCHKEKKEVTKNYANLSKSEKQLLMEIYYLPGHCVNCYENFAITQLCDLGMLENSDEVFLGVWTEKGVKCFYEVSEQAKKLIREEKREENRGKKHGKRRW